jgi:hypothetical protein
MNRVRELFGQVESADFFRALNPHLTIGRAAGAPARAPQAPLGARLDALRREGHAAAPGIVAAAEAEGMARAIGNLEASGVPAVFAYVYDAFWEPLLSLAPLVESALGPFDVLDDVWAWLVPAGRSGWSPHRGRSILERSSGGRPVTLNVWIALTEVTAADACIHVVPLNEDPFYPDRLLRVDVPRGLGRALPAAAGTALLWDANVLHWGGACVGPGRRRVSISYTLRARAAAPIPGTTPVIPAALSFRARLDLVARQIATYAEKERVFSPAAEEWARATAGFLAIGARRARRSS